MSIYAFGDSHVQYFFQLCPDIKTFYLGQRTMDSVAVDGAAFVPHLARPGADDTIVLVFGEIDVRCHIARVADVHNQILDWTVGDLVTRYVEKIRQTLDHFGIRSRVVMMGVTPPMDPVVADPELPTYGPLDQRINVRRMLDSVLENHAKAFGITFVPIPTVYENRDGSMLTRLSDGHGHITMDHADRVCSALGERIGIPLAFNRLPLSEQLHIDALREQALQRRDYEAMLHLGSLDLTSAAKSSPR